MLRFPCGLNTQSCIKGLFGVRDFCFWVIWVAWPSWVPIMSNFWGLFFHVFMVNFFLNTIVRIEKLHNMYLFARIFFWPRKHEKTCFLGLRQFSNLMVLNKGLPIQDLVFRLGQTPFFLCSLYSSRVDVQKLWSCQNWWLVDFFFTLKFRISIIHAYLFPAKNSHFQNLQVLSLFSI